MAGGAGCSKNGIGKPQRSRSRASTPSRFFSCCKIHFAGFSEKRPSRVLPTMTEMTVMPLLLAVGLDHNIGAFPNRGSLYFSIQTIVCVDTYYILTTRYRGVSIVTAYIFR